MNNNSIELARGLIDLAERNIDVISIRYANASKDYYKQADIEMIEFARREKELLEDKLVYWNEKLHFYRWLTENIGFKKMTAKEFAKETRRLEKVYESEVK